jgi:hypothetical protein
MRHKQMQIRGKKKESHPESGKNKARKESCPGGEEGK